MRPSLPLVFVETTLVVLLATGIAWVVFASQAGLVAVFLASIGMQESFTALLECNRRDIWEGRLTPYRANGWLILALVTIFLGSLLAFSSLCWSLPARTVRELFGAQLELTPLVGLDLARLEFPSAGVLLGRNLWVFVISFVVAAVFRSTGALLILTWNASVWSFAFAYLSRATVALGLASLPSTLVAIGIGITPHLVLEASGYVIASMCGIFAAKGIEKYSWRDPRFSRVLRAVAVLLSIGLVSLLLGALVESNWPGRAMRAMLR